MKNKNNRYKITKEKIETGKVTSKSGYLKPKGGQWVSRASSAAKGWAVKRSQISSVENSQIPKTKNPKPPKNK